MLNPIAYNSHTVVEHFKCSILSIACLVMLMMGNTGELTAQNKEVITSDITGPRVVATGDITGNNHPDLVVGATLDSSVVYYENMGDSYSSAHIIDSTLKYPRAIALADFDNDGDLDVAAAAGQSEIGSSNDVIKWYANMDGEFPADTIVDGNSPIDNVQDIAVGDFDSDGDPDIVAANRDNSAITYHNNLNNSPDFETSSIGQSANGPTVVFAADLDSSGTTDIIYGTQSGDELVWRPNGGGANFSSKQVIQSNVADPSDLSVADLDGDNDMDIVSSSYGDNTVAWYENDGSEQFTERTITSSADSASAVHVADMNGDGALDVLVASAGGDSLSWYANHIADVPGSFTFGVTFDREALGVMDVKAADMDGDGDADPVQVSYRGDELAVYPDQTFETTINTPAETPGKISLGNNYPNPFNPTTTIQYSLPKAVQVELTVTNLLGQKVSTLIDQKQRAGQHTARFNAGNLSSGVYFYKLEAGNVTKTKRMMLVK